MNGINLRRFEFDYDTTWNAFFLDEKLNIYSRYGGRDAGEPAARLSKESLLQTMREVLAVHAARNKPAVKDALPSTQPVAAGVLRPRDIPLLKSNHRGCVHCHQVREYQLLQASKDGKFSRRMIYRWPLPENVGMVFDRKHGHRIQRTIAASPAGKAGIQPGDVIEGINKIPIHSEYDVRWVLGRAEDGKPLRISILRQLKSGTAQRLTVVLNPKGRWRDSELGWRKSLRSVPLLFGFRGYSLTRSQRRDLGMTPSQLAVRIVTVGAKGLARQMGIRKRDTILALDKQTSRRSLEQLKSDILRRYSPGKTIRITVLRNGKRVNLQGRFPHWKYDDNLLP